MGGGTFGATLCSFLSLLAAGCSGTTPEASPAAAEPTLADEGFSASEGGLSGVVVDQSLAPVANATAELQESAKDGKTLASQSTGRDGRFAFGHLKPATYRITVEGAGFQPSTQLVQIVAGEAARTRVTLTTVPTQQPYVDVLILNGVTGCHMTVVWLIVGLPCNAVDSTYKTQFKLTIPDDWAYAVYEIAWRTSDAIWSYVQFDSGSCLNPGTPCPGAAGGLSPLRYDGAPASGLNTSKYEWGTKPYPPAGKGFDLYLNAADAGMFYKEINTYGKPICDLNGYCDGVGTNIEIRFVAYVSIFHATPPPAPEKYTALPDE